MMLGFFWCSVCIVDMILLVFCWGVFEWKRVSLLSCCCVVLFSGLSLSLVVFWMIWRMLFCSIVVMLILEGVLCCCFLIFLVVFLMSDLLLIFIDCVIVVVIVIVMVVEFFSFEFRGSLECILRCSFCVIFVLWLCRVLRFLVIVKCIMCLGFVLVVILGSLFLLFC